MIAYHFVSNTLRDGSPIPKNGEWLKYGGKIKLCASGYHASKHPYDALQYAPGNTLCLVDCRGEIFEGDDKIVASERMIVERFDAEDLLFKFARDCALSVVHLWDAPKVVVEYLETGRDDLRAAAWAAAWDAARDAERDAARDAARPAARAAARAAAWAAAWDAARDAARAAAWDAARDAARDAQRAKFKLAVDTEFKKLGAM